MKENIDDLKARILRESQRLTESQKKLQILFCKIRKFWL